MPCCAGIKKDSAIRLMVVIRFCGAVVILSTAASSDDVNVAVATSTLSMLAKTRNGKVL